MTTIYEYNNQELYRDEADAYQPEELLRHYAQHFPELNQAGYTMVPPPEEGGPRKIIFAKKVGTKGSGFRVQGSETENSERRTSHLILLIALNMIKPKPVAAWELIRRIGEGGEMTLERLLALGPEIEAAHSEALVMAGEGERICQALYHLQPAPSPQAPQGF